MCVITLDKKIYPLSFNLLHIDDPIITDRKSFSNLITYDLILKDVDI